MYHAMSIAKKEIAVQFQIYSNIIKNKMTQSGFPILKSYKLFEGKLIHKANL